MSAFESQREVRARGSKAKVQVDEPAPRVLTEEFAALSGEVASISA